MFRMPWVLIIGLGLLSPMDRAVASEPSVCPYVQSRCQATDGSGHPLDGSRCKQGLGECPSTASGERGCSAKHASDCHSNCDFECTTECGRDVEAELDSYTWTCPFSESSGATLGTRSRPQASSARTTNIAPATFSTKGWVTLTRVLGTLPSNAFRLANAEDRVVVAGVDSSDRPAILFIPENPNGGTRHDPELARLQQVYRMLKESGLHAEAASVASRIEHGGAVSVLFHQSGYQPTLPGFSSDPIRFQGGDIAWDEAAENPVSVHFEGKSVDEVAYFFHLATGMTVRVEPCGETMPRIYVTSERKTVRRTLQKVLGTCKWGYCVVDGELVLAPSKHLDRFQKPGIISGLDVWRGE